MVLVEVGSTAWRSDHGNEIKVREAGSQGAKQDGGLPPELI